MFRVVAAAAGPLLLVGSGVLPALMAPWLVPPAAGAAAGLLILCTAGLALASGVVIWRVGGGLFENPLEDDAVGLALLGPALALGAFLCVRRRTGWPAPGRILAGMGACGMAAGITIALA